MPGTKQPPEPWRSFFSELDGRLHEPADLHLCGGFVVTQLYGIGRTTADVDFLAVIPHSMELQRLAGRGSELHRKHKVYLDPVAVATAPENYQERLVALFPNLCLHLHLYGLEVHDLALTKLERNIDRDREDIRQLAQAGYLKRDILEERYRSELRPYLANVSRHDLTLQLWMEAYW